MNSLSRFQKASYLAIASLLLVNPFIITCSQVKAGQNQPAVESLIARARDVEDLGDIKINHSPVGDADYEEVHQIIKKTQIFEEIASVINEELALPADIKVNFTECGEENAYYDPEKIEISMCYELIQKYAEIFAAEAESGEEIVKEVIYAALFTFLHELGHALVDQLELPITGREEDVVDEFAAIVLLQAGDEGEEAALAGVLQFAVDAEEERELDELAYWDEHSLGIQRFYNMACLVYGSNPEKYADLVGEDGLPEERAESCEYEYAQKSKSWETLLSPYWKE